MFMVDANPCICNCDMDLLSFIVVFEYESYPATKCIFNCIDNQVDNDLY